MTIGLLHHAFEATARRLPAKTAIVSGEERTTYAELARYVAGLTFALQVDGMQPGDRVLIFLESSVEYVVALHAVLAAGAVVVPVSPMTKADKLVFLADDTQAKVLLTHAHLSKTWAQAVPHMHALTHIRVAGDPGSVPHDPRLKLWPGIDDGGEPRRPQCIDQDLAALIYTSGSTGVPKGVMLTHHNMTSAWAAVQAYLQLREDDVIGLALPPTFSYGMYNILMGVGIGSTVVLERSAAFPIRLAQMLERERVSVFPGVPTLFGALLELADFAKFDLRAIRLLTNAAASLPATYLRQIQLALPHARFYSMYGLTECKRVSYLSPDEIDARPESVGRGMPNQEHWLVDDLGQRLPNGSTGELVVRGSHVMRGYWNRPAETAARLRPGRIAGENVLHTGDIFRTDSDGYLYFVARKDDIIKTRGEKVAPREVENAIHMIESITGCAVVGVPDPVLGEAVKAYVTLRSGSMITPRDIIRHCLNCLENHMAPKFVEVVDELPRTESGKIRHATLREQ
ncbi:MAG: class I adenylate-forming enzyme family protein [Burkholderiales bacterium]